MTGGAHRGPIAPQRQRRTLRFIQILLVLAAAGLIAFAGYSYGRVDGYEAGKRVSDLDPPRPPSMVQPIVLVILGGLALTGAALLQDGDTVRMPTPARLEDLATRAEQSAIDRAEELAGRSDS